MSALSPTQQYVAENVLLDSRLALTHTRDRWLAVADLHFGFELSQRAAGRLVPLWGMQSARERLMQLIQDYAPRHLVVVGDIVHDKAAAVEARELITKARERCEVILIAGNHDRQIAREVGCVESWISGEFHFHHGHCARETDGRIQIIGHHHPAATLRDGAGLRLKFPAFVQENRCWILPAFSAWAGGASWARGEQSRVWLCTPQRILELPETESATAA